MIEEGSSTQELIAIIKRVAYFEQQSIVAGHTHDVVNRKNNSAIPKNYCLSYIFPLFCILLLKIIRLRAMCVCKICMHAK